MGVLFVRLLYRDQETFKIIYARIRRGGRGQCVVACRVAFCVVGTTAFVAALAVGFVIKKGTCFCLFSVRQVLRRICLEGAVGFMTIFPARDEACSWCSSNSLRFTRNKLSHCLTERHGYPFLCWLDFSSFGASRDSIMSHIYFHRTSPRF